MALSIDTIFKPLNDFFMSRFGSMEGAEVLFRFDKIGSIISDADFVDQNHPDLGYLPALAIEKFSDLVNRVPIECGDGLNVLLGQNSIDDTYFYRLLKPAVPFIPDGTDNATKQALIDDFNTEKAKALQLWNENDMESLTGLMLEYRPSVASPQTWYETGKSDVWTSQTFEITEPAEPQDAAAADIQLWKLMPSAQILTKLIDAEPLPVPPPGGPGPPQEAGQVDSPELTLRARLQEVRGHPDFEMAVARSQPVRISPALRQVGVIQLPVNVRAGRATKDPDIHLAGAVTPVILANQRAPVIAAVPVADQPGTRVSAISPQLRATFAEQVSRLDMRDRLLLNGVIDEQVPTEKTKTNSVTVTFDYCLVDVSRPWLFDVFLNSGNWGVPGTDKGALTQVGTAGAMAELPIGVVVIRNLVITANWDADDVANSDEATAFGPFKIDGGVVDGSIRHQSIQTIGWILQQLPALPPQQVGVPAPP